MVILAWYLTGYLVTEFIMDVIFPRFDNIVLALLWPLLWIVAIVFIVALLGVNLLVLVFPPREYENNIFYIRKAN